MRATEFLRPIEVKATPTGEITGYGSVFNNVDLGGDVVLPGAFAKTLRERMPAMLWGHSASEPVGVWTEAKEDGRGLFLKGKLTLGTTRGDDAHKLARDGAMGLSIGYRSIDVDWRDDTRVLKEVQLFEVSLVGLPMNDQARVTSVKSVTSEIRTAVDFERWLKSQGFASRLARRLSAGWNAAVGRPDDDAAEKFTALLEQSAARIRQGL